jgi:hypothetical protein
MIQMWVSSFPAVVIHYRLRVISIALLKESVLTISQSRASILHSSSRFPVYSGVCSQSSPTCGESIIQFGMGYSLSRSCSLVNRYDDMGGAASLSSLKVSAVSKLTKKRVYFLSLPLCVSSFLRLLPVP